jgi:hypothetical protein
VLAAASRTEAPRRRASRRHVAAGVAVAASVAALAWAIGDEPNPEVQVYPTAGTLAARATTSVTFRGVGPDALEDATVTGQRSGRHDGRWISHPDGRGAEFRPDEPFVPGERVTVDAGMPISGSHGNRVLFTIARGARTPRAPVDVPPAVPPGARVQSFRSRPDLRPPAIGVDVLTPAASRGSIFVGPKRGQSQQGPMIVDASGELVWFEPLPGREQAFDFRVQTYRGEPVLTWWQGDVAIYRGDGVGRILDTNYRPVASVRAGNGYELDVHEFKLTSRGTALVISYETVPWDLSGLGGQPDGLVEDNIVQEVDVESGAVLFEWHALGNIELDESYRTVPREKSKIHDPFHLNSVELEPDGNLLVSARHANAVYKIDRRSGEVLWRLGGKQSTYALGPGVAFKLQHDARRHPDGTITLFDNVAEDLPARGRESRGIRLRLDEDAKRATLVQELTHPDALLSPTQGSMQALDGGGAFIGWGGSQPVFSESDRDGQAVFSARFLAKKVESYRAYRMPWDGHAPGRPSVVARAQGGTATVYVSWNGATDVASWRVLAGGPGALRKARTVPRDGFETSIRLDARPRSVAVQALDASGQVLGRSRDVVVD